DGVHGPSEVIDPSAFPWTDARWVGVEPEDLVVYELHVGTFSPEGTFDGILAANSLHFVRDRKPVLAAIRRALRPGGRLVIVEYDADIGNHWVPFPFSFERWRQEAAVAGLTDVALLRRVPSRFLGGIYGAVAVSPALPPDSSGTAGRL
ncbi:MAG: methyltransferase domain-containing protein, partial [Chloroflexota bacterium]